MSDLKKWMKNATRKEIESLAKAARTTAGYLRHIADGRRKASPDVAGRIENASATLSGRTHMRLPVILRGEISRTCKACDYYKRCAGRK